MRVSDRQLRHHCLVHRCILGRRISITVVANIAIRRDRFARFLGSHLNGDLRGVVPVRQIARFASSRHFTGFGISIAFNFSRSAGNSSSPAGYLFMLRM
jgi:hypothetical protein